MKQRRVEKEPDVLLKFAYFLVTIIHNLHFFGNYPTADKIISLQTLLIVHLYPIESSLNKAYLNLIIG